MNITKEYIDKHVTYWELRHDDWAREYLSSFLQTDKKCMNEIKPIFKVKLENDWRFSLAFFIDRTTYQSRKDTVNIRTATYLFEKIIELPVVFNSEHLSNMIKKIAREKENGYVTHIRVKTDIQRLTAVCDFLIDSPEKNFTNIVLNLVDKNKDIWRFMDQFPYVSRNKTAPFYMKFIAWLFQLDVVPLTIDRHVINSLMKHNLVNSHNVKEARYAIKKISKELSMPAVNVETALYESSWGNINS